MLNDRKSTENKRVKIFPTTQIQLGFTLYDYCYDDKNNLGTSYAYYDLHVPSLLNNEALEDEQNYKFKLQKPSKDEFKSDILLSSYYENVRISNSSKEYGRLRMVNLPWKQISTAPAPKNQPR